MLPTILGPAARAETLEAYNWYAARSPAIADRFIDESDAAIARITENPLLFSSWLAFPHR